MTEQALMDFGIGTAANTVSSAIIVPLIHLLIKEIRDVINLENNRQVLKAQLNRMQDLLSDISTLFQDQQREAPVSLDNCLLRIQTKVREGGELIRCSQLPWPQQCINCLCCKPRVYTQIREWSRTFAEFFDELQGVILIIQGAQQIVAAAPQQEGVLLQELPVTGLIGKKIKDAETKLQSWVPQAPHVHIICVYGMPGVGKTTFLKKVYNTYKQVSHSFDHVIWVTVSRFPNLTQMQNDIASAINLDLAIYSADMRKIKLSAYLKNMKFFLVLDDMWNALNLRELGVGFGENKGSKLVFTTRNKNLIAEMEAQGDIEIEALDEYDAWELFGKVAFKLCDVLPGNNIYDIARKVAGECKGLPLALEVIASAMIGKSSPDDWNRVLRQMETVDATFAALHPLVEEKLYRPLRWSYDCLPANLPANLKACFLFGAVFPEDAIIDWNELVEMWIGEGLIETKTWESLMATGQDCVQFLIDRSLFQQVGLVPQIRVHDVLRDLAIYIGETEENCVFSAGQMIEDFAKVAINEHCKRISICDNNITSLRDVKLSCANLVTLILRGNTKLVDVPGTFLANLTSLKVLDMSRTQIKSLPTSLWQLTHLRYLNLNDTKIEDLSPSIGSLSELQFLYLIKCTELKLLRPEIGELKKLRILNLTGSLNYIESIPPEIGSLRNCNIIRS